MFKDFLVKKLVASKLKALPQEQQDMIVQALEKNPDFFMQIGKEIEEKVKSGKDQTSAAMEVFRTHQSELKELLS